MILAIVIFFVLLGLALIILGSKVIETIVNNNKEINEQLEKDIVILNQQKNFLSHQLQTMKNYKNN